jgi:hypothetical protein
MKNQTAVEWLIEQLTEVERKNWINNKILSIGKNTLAKQTFDGIINQAKEMEKQQIMNAVYDSMGTNFDANMGRAKLYYDTTFKKD